MFINTGIASDECSKHEVYEAWKDVPAFARDYGPDSFYSYFISASYSYSYFYSYSISDESSDWSGAVCAAPSPPPPSPPPPPSVENWGLKQF